MCSVEWTFHVKTPRISPVVSQYMMLFDSGAVFHSDFFHCRGRQEDYLVRKPSPVRFQWQVPYPPNLIKYRGSVSGLDFLFNQFGYLRD